MQSVKVTLKGTLKMGNGDILSKGHVFRGPVESFPEEIQKMVKKKSSVLLIQNDAPSQEEIIAKHEAEKAEAEKAEAEAKKKAEAEKAEAEAEAKKKELNRPAKNSQKKG